MSPRIRPMVAWILVVAVLASNALANSANHSGTCSMPCCKPVKIAKNLCCTRQQISEIKAISACGCIVTASTPASRHDNLIPKVPVQIIKDKEDFFQSCPKIVERNEFCFDFPCISLLPSG